MRSASAATTAGDVTLVALAKTCIGLVVLAGGFRAVSDDDYARVVIAEELVRAPRIDASGTSWLPLPFWVTAAVLRLGGATLETARVAAFAGGVAAAVLVYAAGRVLLRDREAALAGALVAAALPWSARLGVATVPELPTAALTLFALATLCRGAAGLRLAGGAALLAACLSRYEPWPPAVLFAILGALDAARARGRRRLFFVGAAVLALAGPLGWMAHNAVAHGSALHFAERVAGYRRALGGASAALSAALALPWALLVEEPELALVTLGLGAPGLATRRSRAGIDGVELSRLVVALALLVATLAAAAVAAAAPTHHAARSLLVVWLAASLYVGARVAGIGRRRPHPGRFAVLLALGVVALALLVRPFAGVREPFAARLDEEEIGRLVRDRVVAGGPILVEVPDHGYHAILAARGRTDGVTLDRSLDPRLGAPRPSSFASADALRARVRETGAAYVVACDGEATRTLDPPLASAGRWRLWAAPRP
jgi:hypothetical protein